jgi:hypothetical protein
MLEMLHLLLREAAPCWRHVFLTHGTLLGISTVECMLSMLGHPVLTLPSSVIHGSMLLAIHSEVTEQYYLVDGLLLLLPQMQLHAFLWPAPLSSASTKRPATPGCSGYSGRS